MEVNKLTDCGTLSTLNFETHHNEGDNVELSESKAKVFEPCSAKYIDYTPFHDQKRAMTFPRDNMIYRERHFPPEDEKLHCLIPTPKGYKNPFPWPKKAIGPKSMSLMVERVISLWSNMELWNILKTTAPSPRKGYYTKNLSRRSTMNPCPHMFFPLGAVSFAGLSICEFLVQN